MLSMAVDILPSYQIVKEVPCDKYICNLRSVMALVTKCLAGRAIGLSSEIKQIHNDAASHKGIEILNCICGVLTRSNQLKTICLAGDIIPENGTAECQSSALVDQFSESGGLLEGWRDATKKMHAGDPELPMLLEEIPTKNSLCVSRTLGAYLSADNCSTARLNTSKFSAKIIVVAKANGIINKKKLCHYFGHCFNHQRNGLCNSVAIGFGRRIGDALADDISAFAPHLRISGKLMNVHR